MSLQTAWHTGLESWQCGHDREGHSPNSIPSLKDGHNKKDSYSVNHVKQSLLQSMQHGGGANFKDAKFYVYEAGSGTANHSFSVKTVNDILFM